MEEPSEKEISIVREYLRKKGSAPDKAAEFLKYLRTHPVRFWPRFIEVVFIGVGVYCVCRHLIRLLLGF